jgi:tetratricopeptide (TPR) repeat protein
VTRGVDPGTQGVDPETRDLLLDGERLLLFGLIDRAEAAFQRARSGDRPAAAALVGLSRVALERGDEAGAYRFAVEALAINPDDEAALRMEARLAEVLAARGEAVRRPAAAAEEAAETAREGAVSPVRDRDALRERRSLLGRILRRG